MDKYKKIQKALLAILLISIGTFCYLMYSWNFAHHEGTWENEDGIYTGEFKGKIMHGTGEFKFTNGAVYNGEWKDGIIEGLGRLTFFNGDYQEGEFKDGLLFNGKMVSKKEDGTVNAITVRDGNIIK